MPSEFWFLKKDSLVFHPCLITRHFIQGYHQTKQGIVHRITQNSTLYFAPNSHVLVSTKTENLYQFDFQDDDSTSAIISSDSKITIELDLKKDLNLRSSFLTSQGEINLDKLMEALDNVAYDVAYKHAQSYQNIPLFNIVSSCDKIKFPNKIDINKKIIITGKIIHNGKSSMELMVTVTQDGGEICQAFFTISAKLKATGESTLENDKILMSSSNRTEKQINVQKSRVERIKEMQQVVPNKQERAMIHNIFVSTQTKVSPRDTKLVGENVDSINAVYEHALKTFQHVSKQADLVGLLIVRDQVFRNALESKIVYSCENKYLVASEMNGKCVYLVFETDKNVLIAPCTYEETVAYISAKRLFDFIQKEQ